jgi:hypothetical protein
MPKPTPKFGWTEEKSKAQATRIERQAERERTDEAFAQLELAIKNAVERLDDLTELFITPPTLPVPDQPNPLWTPGQPNQAPYNPGYYVDNNTTTTSNTKIFNFNSLPVAVGKAI